MLGFMGLTMAVVLGGVENGIERWSRRLMPLLIATLVALSAYVLTLDGALVGLQTYLLPDFRKVVSGDLLLDALRKRLFLSITGRGHRADLRLLPQ